MVISFFKKRPYFAATSVILLISLLRLFLAGKYPLSPDEAHYWMWAKFLDWFYFSKGPVIGWLIALGTTIGGDTELGVRWLAVTFAAGTLFLMFHLGTRLFSPAVGWICLIAGIIAPMFAFGSIVMTIDSPSVFFWAAACTAGWNAWRTNASHWWILTGLCIGLGFLSKYTNAVQGICFFLLLLATARGRKFFLTPQPWLGVATAIFCTLPYWVWNANNNWISWDHLLSRGQLTVGESETVSFAIQPLEFLTFLALQALVVSPLLWLLMLVALFWSLRIVFFTIRSSQNTNPLDPDTDEGKILFLLSQCIPLFLFFAFFALNDTGQPNWTAPGYVAAGLLTGVMLIKFWHTSRPLRYFTIAAVIVAVISTIAIHDTRPFRLPPDADPLARVRGWDTLSEKIITAKNYHNADFILANHYGLVSALCWHLPGERTGMRVFRSQSPNHINDQFSLWPNYFDRVGQNAIMVVQLRTIREGATERPPRAIRGQFEDWEPIGEPFWIEQDGLRVAPYAMFLMKRLKPTSDFP